MKWNNFSLTTKHTRGFATSWACSRRMTPLWTISWSRSKPMALSKICITGVFCVHSQRARCRSWRNLLVFDGREWATCRHIWGKCCILDYWRTKTSTKEASRYVNSMLLCSLQFIFVDRIYTLFTHNITPTRSAEPYNIQEIKQLPMEANDGVCRSVHKFK